MDEIGAGGEEEREEEDERETLHLDPFLKLVLEQGQS
jgi:hypothetical protein